MTAMSEMDASLDALQAVRRQLVEAGGRTAQDLGVGRMSGQVLMHLYLIENEQSLDEIEAALGLSKAAVSGVTRRLEQMGFLKRCWRQGDRRVYYRTADNLGTVLRDGIAGMVRRKLEQAGVELEHASAVVAQAPETPEVRFLHGRIQRAAELQRRIDRVMRSRLLRYLVR